MLRLVRRNISTINYHKRADETMESLLNKLEDLQERRTDIDVDYSAGVLTLTIENKGTYVINKQPPNKQIWLSSPVSGPKRYDWVGEETTAVGGEWIYSRDKTTLQGLLDKEVFKKIIPA